MKTIPFIIVLKNKIHRNKFNRGKNLYTENYETLLKEMKEVIIGKVFHFD